jgi:hypothetical protein
MKTFLHFGGIFSNLIHHGKKKYTTEKWRWTSNFEIIIKYFKIMQVTVLPALCPCPDANLNFAAVIVTAPAQLTEKVPFFFKINIS